MRQSGWLLLYPCLSRYYPHDRNLDPSAGGTFTVLQRSLPDVMKLFAPEIIAKSAKYYHLRKSAVGPPGELRWPPQRGLTREAQPYQSLIHGRAGRPRPAALANLSVVHSP